MFGKGISLVLAYILCISFSIGQVQVNFQPKLNGHNLILGDSSEMVRVDQLKFYVSNLSFYNDSNLVWQEENSYHLLDAEKPTSFNWILNTPDDLFFNQFVFTLGIDSATNAAGVHGNDLDPTNGMYWSWQSGYINFKIEGQSSQSTARNNNFQLHLGGYKNGFATAQTVRLLVRKSTKLQIDLHLDPILSAAFKKGKPLIMSPSKIAQSLSAITAANFKYHE